MDTEDIYTPIYKDELNNLINWIQVSAFDPLTRVDPMHTSILVKFFFGCIKSTICSVYALLEAKHYVQVGMLFRPLVEYSADMRYLSINDNPMINRRFLEYHILWLYWNSGLFETIDVRSAVEQAYWETATRLWHELHKDDTPSGDKKEIVLPTKIDKEIKHKYNTSWRGVGFDGCLAELEEAAQAKGSYFPNLRLYFKSYCNDTHPSPYSILPHYSPGEGTFKNEWVVTDEWGVFAEEFLILLLDLNAESISLVIQSNPPIHKSYQEEVRKCAGINKWLFGSP